MLTQELLDAYRATHYRVEHPAGAFTLRISQQSPELVNLMQASGQVCAAFITAWNPYSQPRSPEENATAQQRLLAELSDMGYVSIPGTGLDPFGQWPGEESLLVLGLPKADAIRLGRKYSQNAVVWAGEDAIPQLL